VVRVKEKRLHISWFSRKTRITVVSGGNYLNTQNKNSMGCWRDELNRNWTTKIYRKKGAELEEGEICFRTNRNPFIPKYSLWTSKLIVTKMVTLNSMQLVYLKCRMMTIWTYEISNGYSKTPKIYLSNYSRVGNVLTKWFNGYTTSVPIARYLWKLVYLHTTGRISIITLYWETLRNFNSEVCWKLHLVLYRFI